MNAFIHPTYFPNIAHFIAIVKSNALCLEICDNYQKQTYRNRTEIYAANGKLALTVPVKYTQKNRQLYKDVKIANEENWQQQHLKSLQSAYSMSPFFEFYVDDLMPLFEKKFEHILDFNLKCFEVLLENLQLNKAYTFSEKYQNNPEDFEDYRTLVKPNTNPFSLQKYTQVFTQKHGFLANLSILDVLFNEGPNTVSFLKKHNL